MHRPSSSPVVGRKGHLLPRINSHPSLATSSQVAYEKFWQADIDVGVGSTQGYRQYHEDEFQTVAFMGPNQLPTAVTEPHSGADPFETHCFAVFDGHAGGRCSKAIASTLAECISRDPAFHNKFPLAIKRGFHRANDLWFKLTEKQRFNDGSTAVCAFVRSNTLVTANVGDSRAILLQNRKAIQLTEDHKPMKLEEQRRIAAFGGSVVNCMGIARVNGVLAVSRAFGNRLLKDVIRADPDIVEREISVVDDFLVLGSDGLYDVLSNQDICNLCYELQGNAAQLIADHLVATALHRGSMDNITAVVVDLRRYVARMGEHAGGAQRTTTFESKATASYPPLAAPRPGTKPLPVPGAPARTFDGRAKALAKHDNAGYQTSGGGVASRHTPPAAMSPAVSALTPHQAERSVVIAGGSTQRMSNLRSLIPRQHFPARPKTGVRAVAHSSNFERSMPLMASNGQSRPSSSPHTLLGKKKKKKPLQQPQTFSSHFMYRTT